MSKLALFRFETSPVIGAGHAIRSTVIADALTAAGWVCKLITQQESYDFIKNLARFERIEPKVYYDQPTVADLLVVDNYDLDAQYEKHFRPFAKKIMVVDGLASRRRDCGLLFDQPYGRDAQDYQALVPSHCKILAGSDYVLLRKEFVELQSKALAKRRNTTAIERILVSMGGNDTHNFTLKALQMIQACHYQGAVDIVLGFAAPHYEQVKQYSEKMLNKTTLHVNADMPKLIYEADLAIGAAGTSVWERYYLGVPQVLLVIADNQEKIYHNLMQVKNIYATLDAALQAVPAQHQPDTLLQPLQIEMLLAYVGN